MTSDGDGRRLRRDAEANRRKILAAADQVMAAEGLGVGHDTIAHAAGVAVGTVYRRFPTKDALVEALFAERMTDVVTAAQAALVAEDAWEGVVTFLTTIMRLQVDSCALRELIAGSPHGRTLAQRARSEISPMVSQLVDQAHAAGVLRPEVVEQDLAVVPIMIGAVIHAARDTQPELWQRMLAIVLDGIRTEHTRPLPAPAATDAELTRILQSNPT